MILIVLYQDSLDKAQVVGTLVGLIGRVLLSYSYMYLEAC